MTFGQEAGEWANARTLRVERTDPLSTTVLFEGDVEAASVDLGAAAPNDAITLRAEVRDANGVAFARGESATFSGQELAGATVPLLLSPLAGSSRASAGLVGAWSAGTASSATLLQGRYVLLADAAGTAPSDELYDVGLLSALRGGPSWPRSPRTLLRATTSDVLVVDGEGGSFTNVFRSGTAGTSSLSPEDASALVGGAVLAGTTDAAGISTGQWLAGPCARRSANVGASDRVLHLTASDALIVSRLPALRLGAACAVSPSGALLIAGGGQRAIAIVDLAGKVTEAALDDDRSFGAAFFSGDGALLLLGGDTANGSAAPPTRIAFPCGDTCVATPVPLGPTIADDALRDLEAFPSEPGHAFFAARSPAGDRWLYGSSTALTTSLAPLAVRLARTSAYAFVLAGERLLVVGGTVPGGPASVDVEILTPP